MTDITNNDAEVSTNSNYTICDRTGFKLLPKADRLSKVRKEWTGLEVRADSLDPRHPSEHVRATIDRQTGPVNPEMPDTFVKGGVWLLAGGDGYVIGTEGGAIGIDG